MTRYKIGVQYIGSRYSGFAFNDSSRLPTIMSTMEVALKDFCKSKATYSNFLSGSRTDAGVHALRNVCQVDISRPASNGSGDSEGVGETIAYDPEALKKGLNYYLNNFKSSIYITDVSVAPPTFSARADAQGRSYMYRILNHHYITRQPRPGSLMNSTSCWSLFHQDRAWTIDKRLDIAKMVEASQFLLGEQDFASFRNIGCQSKSTIRDLKSIDIYHNKRLITVNDLHSAGWFDPSKASAQGAPEYLSLLVRQVRHLFQSIGC